MRILTKSLPEATTEFEKAVKDFLENQHPARVPIYTYQDLIAANPRNYSGYIVRCINGDAGDECLAYCDGFTWQVVELKGKISL